MKSMFLANLERGGLKCNQRGGEAQETDKFKTITQIIEQNKSNQSFLTSAKVEVVE